MLTWMQHHKKYLVVTIWISVIAFIGAGFLGWGAYDFNLKRSSSVATVGNEKIAFNEFDTRFRQIFNYYNQINNGVLGEENVKDLGIEHLALTSLVEDKLLLNFAKDLGLRASENELLEKLINTVQFQDPTGDFNKSIYYELLNANHLTPKAYEAMLADEIIITKLGHIFNIPSKDEELKMLASSYFMQDALSIAKIDYDEKKVRLNEEDLKDFWSQHQEDYKSEKLYEISTYFLAPNNEKIDDEKLKQFYNQDENKFKYKDFEGKLMDFKEIKDELAKDYAFLQLKNTANSKFIDLKNAKDNFQKDEKIDQTHSAYPIDLLDKAQDGDILRPVPYNDGYVIIRLNKTHPIRNKTFKEAREELLPLYLKQEARKNLEKEAKNNLASFKGQNIGFVSRDSSIKDLKLKNELLDDSEFAYFLMNVFNSDQNSSYVLMNDNKAILYKINKQKLDMSSDKFKQHKMVLEQNLQDLKVNELKQELVHELKKIYPVKIYYKGN